VPLARLIAKVVKTTRPAPRIVRYAAAIAISTSCLGVRMLLTPYLPAEANPFLLGFLAVMLTALLFDLAASLLSVSITSGWVIFFYMWHTHLPGTLSGPQILVLGLFFGISGFLCLILETLHGAMEGLRGTMDNLHLALDHLSDLERRRSAMFLEFRHRSRNDLTSIAAMLMLRGKLVEGEECRQALHEGAQHTRDLALIHTWMEGASYDREDVAWVDSRTFVLGLCGELPNPVLNVAAESHRLSGERAVQLGLLICEMVRDARNGQATAVSVVFLTRGELFELQVSDDRNTEVSSTDLRARMCHLLAKQLRGELRQRDTSLSVVSFPRDAPNLAAQRVGR
jgi:two-component system, sensor histidine kinase PdtaS